MVGKNPIEAYLFELLQDMKVINLSLEEKKTIKQDVSASMNYKKSKKHLYDIKIKNKCKSRCFKLWLEEQAFCENNIRENILPKIKE